MQIPKGETPLPHSAECGGLKWGGEEWEGEEWGTFTYIRVPDIYHET